MEGYDAAYQRTADHGPSQILSLLPACCDPGQREGPGPGHRHGDGTEQRHGMVELVGLRGEE